MEEEDYKIVNKYKINLDILNENEKGIVNKS